MILSIPRIEFPLQVRKDHPVGLMCLIGRPKECEYPGCHHREMREASAQRQHAITAALQRPILDCPTEGR